MVRARHPPKIRPWVVRSPSKVNLKIKIVSRSAPYSAIALHRLKSVRGDASAIPGYILTILAKIVILNLISNILP